MSDRLRRKPLSMRAPAARAFGAMTARPKIGISACFFHADPARPVFTGKTLQYVEQSIVHWVQSSGALAFVIPSPDGPTQRGDVTLADYAGWLDGLVLEGGSDMWPGSYGEEPLRPEWRGDRIRDEYEIALLRAFVDAGKPVLGICRGLQVINVAFGGTLYQDIATQLPGFDRASQRAAVRPELPHDRGRSRHPTGGAVSASRLPGAGPSAAASRRQQRAPSGHPGPCALFRGRGALPERRRHRGDPVRLRTRPVQSYLAAVQWHPEFHDWKNASILSGDALLSDFLNAARATRRESASAC